MAHEGVIIIERHYQSWFRMHDCTDLELGGGRGQNYVELGIITRVVLMSSEFPRGNTVNRVVIGYIFKQEYKLAWGL